MSDNFGRRADDRHASDSQAPAQLRLPLMARAEGPGGLPSPNPEVVDRWRVFVLRKSAAEAKDVAALTGARPSRVHNEDEGRTILSAGTLAARLLVMPALEQKRFLNDLCELLGLAPYAPGLRDLDDSAAGAVAR